MKREELLTLEDLYRLYEQEGLAADLNDGYIVGFHKEKSA